MCQCILGILQSLLGDWIKDQIGYVFCFRRNVDRLKNESEKLQGIIDTVNLQVDAAKRNLETIRPDVESWLTGANAVKTTSSRVLEKADIIQNRCPYEWCPIIHYSVSQEAKTTTDASVQLQNEASRFESSVSIPFDPAALPPLPAEYGIQFKSREAIEKEIMEALKDDSIYLIGLCGMGGIGKTTMTKKIEYWAKSTSMFQHVGFAVVSQRSDQKEVQQQIAERIGLTFEQEDSVQMRADKLHARLNGAESFLIIMDDVWKRLDLAKFGIPSKNTQKRFKLILTSRGREFLPSKNDSKILGMDSLTDVEAWSLFRQNAGDSVDAPDIRDTAKEVAEQCKCLPLALVVVARALGCYTNERPWKDALLQLKRSIPPATIAGTLEDELYKPLRWSYDQLPSDEARYIFLLCCLFPEDSAISIETLVRYGWGLRIFNGVENLTEARDRVYGLVETLKFRFLLIDAAKYVRGSKCVKMHDVIRDLAISIASKGRHVFLVNDERNEWPIKDSYESYTHSSITLKGNNALPVENKNWPRLEFFRMESRCGQMLQLPLAAMTHLKVLELSNIQLVPSPICLLTNLRELHLHNCRFVPTSFFDKLVNLEILSLQGLYFEELPKEVGSLTKLKLLDLAGREEIVRIAPGVISRLVQLEELLISDCNFSEWEAEEGGNERRNAGLAEVASLRNLVSLEIRIGNPKLLSFDSRNKPKLEAFSVQMPGVGIVFRKDYKYKKVILCKCEEVTQIGNFFGAMIRNADYVWLEGDGCTNILKELATEGFQKVKVLNVEGCNDVDALQTDPQNVVSFAALESLSLRSCPSLKSLTLNDLHAFKTRLENLYIGNCPEMEEVFKEGVEVDITVKNTRFLELRELRLAKLPGLKAFCKGIESIDFPALAELLLVGLPEMKGFCITKCNQNQEFLFNKEISCPNLKHITLSWVSCPIGIFDNGIPVGNFSGLKTLEVKSCHGLRGIFSPPMFKGLTNLREIVLTNCRELKEVIASEEGQEGQTRSKETLFPQLQHLELSNLPKIISPEKGGEGQIQVKETVFPRLKDLKLITLPNVHRFCQMKHDIELPSLETMEINDCPMLETFSSGFLHSTTKVLITKEVICVNLQRLELCKVNSVTGLFSYSVSRGLTNLRILRLQECKKLNEVISPEKGGEGQRPQEPQIKETVFPRLKDLKLIKLPSIHRFCKMTSGLELPSPESVEIEDCPNFSVGSLHLLSLKNVRGIQEP